jgi:hypothetical protein
MFDQALFDDNQLNDPSAVAVTSKTSDIYVNKKEWYHVASYRTW